MWWSWYEWALVGFIILVMCLLASVVLEWALVGFIILIMCLLASVVLCS